MQQQYSSPQRLEHTYIRQPPGHMMSSPSSASVGNMSLSPMQMQSGGTPDQDVIDHAARTLDKLMNKDLQLPSLYKSLTQVADPNSVISGNRPVSGFMDYDYPPYPQRNVITDQQFTVTYNTPIPSDLNEMLNQADVQYCHMGLFPEIYRAWMTIDSDIYLWDFRDGTDLSFFDGLKEPIITMSLVPVKRQIFQNSIKHLLCVTTASEIVILGFILSDHASSNSSSPVIELVPQPIFVVPTEGITFNVIHGTKNGRIFLGGNDGSIHEINYKSEKGWMTDRCWKTNLTRSYLTTIFKFMSSSATTDPVKQIVSDDSRNLLYTLNQSGCLQVYDLGHDGTGFSRFGYITFEGVVNEVVNLSKKTLESNIVKSILTIAPVTTGELNLIVVLDNGTRLYFSCYNPPTGNIQAPNYFHLVHVRMPPGYCTATVMPKPSVSHTAFATPGLLTLASRTAQDNDSFWMISPFMYPVSCLSEVFTIQKLPGQTLDIKLIPSSNLSGSSGFEHLPDVITQHLNWHREIVVLTSVGTCVLRAHKPYEMLKNLLIQSGNTDNLRSHFESGVSKEQPLANAALLAVHPVTRSEPNILEMAMKAFFLYGTEGRQWGDGRINSPFDNTMDFNPNLVSTPRQETIGGQGQNMHSMSNVGGGVESGYMSPPLAGGGGGQQQYGLQSPYSLTGPSGELLFSPRHDAIYLVVGRVLFHFWNRTLVNSGTADGTGTPPIITPNIHSHEVTQAITFLQNIITFINNNPSLYMSRVNLSSGMHNINSVESRQLYSQEMEKNSIIALREFLSLSLEVLNMWKILCDHQFHIVLHGVDNQLQNSTMRDLVITGHATVSVIINALISKYLGDNAAVDAISMRLREVCPTLFKSEDAIGSKVAEILAKVKNSTNSEEREILLKESLVLSEKICGHGRVNIRNLCKQYSDLGFPVGAVRLCVSAAAAADPEKLGLDTIRTNAGMGDSIGMQAYQTRAEIYRIVFDLLDNYVQLASTNQSPLLRSVEDRISPQTAQLCAEETIHAILSSDDEVFHISLYNWLLEKKQFDRLLEIKHPYLDSFLQRAADAVVSGKWTAGGISANDTRVLDLLWRHHEMNQNHSAAAQILSKLAESTTTGLNLQQRLEYMSRAIICSKSCSRRGDLLETLEDKVEVAQIQKNILDGITSKISRLLRVPGSENDSELKLLQDAATKLNSQLLSITQLYAGFAHPLKLNDAKLEIFYAAGQGDKQTIEAVWSEIIEEELATSAQRSTESQMEIIRRKIVILGKKYKTSPTFFPIDFLIEHLEAMKPQDSENVTWVFKTMLEVGISFPEVLIIYERLWIKYINRSGAAGGDCHTAKVIMFMIDSLAKQELDIRTTFLNRPDLLEKCKDLISAMIVEFSSRFDPSSAEMTRMLNRVRERLDRVI